MIDEAYTRLLRSALNVSWRDHVPNIILYGNLSKISTKIRERRMSLAGHCVRHKEEEASKLVLQQQGKELIEANVKQPTSIPY